MQSQAVDDSDVLAADIENDAAEPQTALPDLINTQDRCPEEVMEYEGCPNCSL